MHYLAGFIHFALAIFFAVHAVRSGRSSYWLFVLFSFPLLGSLVYFIAEYMPNMKHTATGRQAIKTVNKILDPGRDLREKKLEFERSATVGNRYAYAQALLDNNQAAEALGHMQVCAAGAYVNDALFVRGLAQAQLMCGQWAESQASFERLFALPNVALVPDDKLGHAMTLAQLNKPSAEAAFLEAVKLSNGPVARCRYAQYLLDQGRPDEAKALYREVVREADLAPKHTQDYYQEWYAIARAGVV